jgi:peroxiredoxin
VSATGTDELTRAAEAAWLERWTAGPTESEGPSMPTGARAPILELLDDSGTPRRLSEFWQDGPALVMFWRHFGCGCGIDRAARLKAEWDGYLAAGLTPVVVGQGEPARAARYRAEHGLPCAVLCDPGHVAYRAYGIGQWQPERVLFDAPAEYWEHSPELGASFQADRRTEGRPLVDDPWRGVAEFVIGTEGLIRLSYAYQYCEDFPDPRVLMAAARLC